MNEFKGTPGPWDYDSALDAIFNKSCLFICDVSDKENARLIAAAPELLKELQLLRAYVVDTLGVGADDCHPEHPLMSSQAAIAKALGDTK